MHACAASYIRAEAETKCPIDLGPINVSPPCIYF